MSVIIPTYNHADFLREALVSVLNQSEQSWEALVVNNFSEDYTEAVVRSFSDARIKLCNFSNHGVIAASRNEGIRLAQGAFVAFLDSDDRWFGDKLRISLQRLQDGFDLVCHAERWFGEDIPSRTVRYGPSSRGEADALLYEGNALSTSAVVVRRECLTKYGVFSEDPKIVTAEDYELWLRLSRNKVRISFIDETLGEYRIHPGGQSRAIERHLAAEISVLTRCFTLSPVKGRTEQQRRTRRLAIAYYGAGRTLQKENSPGAANKYFVKALRIYPWLPKLWAAFALNFARLLR